MSCNISLHAALEIEAEYPENSYSITLKEQGTRTTVNLYLDLFQWWKMRSIFPRSKTYTFHTMADNNPLRNQAADDWALQYFDAQKATLAAKPPPEPAPTQDELEDEVIF